MIQLILVSALVFTLSLKPPQDLALWIDAQCFWILAGIVLSFPVYFLFHSSRLLSILPLAVGYALIVWEPLRASLPPQISTFSVETAFYGFLAVLANLRHLLPASELNQKIEGQRTFNSNSFALFFKILITRGSLLFRLLMVLLFGLFLGTILDQASTWIQIEDSLTISKRGLTLIAMAELSVFRKHG